MFTFTGRVSGGVIGAVAVSEQYKNTVEIKYDVIMVVVKMSIIVPRNRLHLP